MTDKLTKQQVQAFMNEHRVTVCYESDGRLYKNNRNAEQTGKPVKEHTLNAGARKKVKTK